MSLLSFDFCPPCVTLQFLHVHVCLMLMLPSIFLLQTKHVQKVIQGHYFFTMVFMMTTQALTKQKQ